MRVVLDPQVFIAAAIAPRGVCARLVDSCSEGDVRVVASPHLIEELADVLSRPRFRRYLSSSEAARHTHAIQSLIELHADVPFEPGLTPDPDNDYLVALAQGAKAEYLVSGDPHVLNVALESVRVLTPRAMLELLTEGAAPPPS